MRIKYDDATIEEIPNEGVEKVDASYSIDLHNEHLNVGDSVDSYSQDGAFNQAWARGYVANISEDGRSCGVIYYDGCYESNIPTKDKIRLIKRCDSSGEWMMGKSVLLSLTECDNIGANGNISLRSGTVSAIETRQRCCRIIFSDGSNDSVSCDEVAKAVFRYLWRDCPPKKQYIWPNNTLSMAESVKLRRQTRNRQKAIKNYASPKTAPKKSGLSSNKLVKVKVTVNGKRYSTKSIEAMVVSNGSGSRRASTKISG